MPGTGIATGAGAGANSVLNVDASPLNPLGTAGAGTSPPPPPSAKGADSSAESKRQLDEALVHLKADLSALVQQQQQVCVGGGVGGGGARPMR